MRVTFLLDPSPLAEVDEIAGLLGDALARRGHVIRIVAPERPSWMRGGRLAEWIETGDWLEGLSDPRDVIVATSDRTETLAPNTIRLPPLVIVDEEIYRDRARRESEPLRVLLAGPSDAEPRRIDDGYAAVAHARWFHQKLDLVRASPWAPSRGEPLDEVQEFHVALDESEMTRLLHSCDVVLVPAMGLIAAEAMAAFLPHVGPERTATELGERLVEVLSDAELRDGLRRRGREQAEQWRPEKVAVEFEKLLSR